MTDDKLTKLLSFDPLGAAEDITGLSYKEDDATQGLGFLFLQENAKAKEEALTANQDTHWNVKFLDTVDIVLDLGFRLVYAQAIRDTTRYGDGKLVHWQAFWRDGILLVIESYGDRLNKANIYYNWRTHTGETTWPDWTLGLSGGWSRRTRIGNGVTYDTEIPDDPWTLCVSSDVREGLRHKLGQIESLDGYVLPEWYVRPFMYLVSYAEKHDENSDDYKTLTREKIERFDPVVRDIILNAPER
ncbi:hypothetical protein SEA_BIG4_249 [Microbacterium phage Big4]|nr:hypothetical protein SEA_BIG4_249 [Microbacterium phage Big4]